MDNQAFLGGIDKGCRVGEEGANTIALWPETDALLDQMETAKQEPVEFFSAANK